MGRTPPYGRVCPQFTSTFSAWSCTLRGGVWILTTLQHPSRKEERKSERGREIRGPQRSLKRCGSCITPGKKANGGRRGRKFTKIHSGRSGLAKRGRHRPQAFLLQLNQRYTPDRTTKFMWRRLAMTKLYLHLLGRSKSRIDYVTNCLSMLQRFHQS